MSYDPSNSFARILRGEAPCIRIAECRHTLAFMDIMPQADGHVLVVPKEPAVVIDSLSDDSAAACIKMVKRIAIAIRVALRPDGLLIVQLNGEAAGQTVGHVHFHVIPRSRDVALRPHSKIPADSAQLESIASRIRAAL